MALAATYVSATNFTVSGDYSADFVVNRKVRCNCGVDGYKYTVVSSASYGSPTTDVNLTTDSDDLTSNLSEVDWSVVMPGSAGNIPLHNHRDEDTGDWASFYDAYVCVVDQKSASTGGGSPDGGSWETRDINTERTDTAGICSVASNQITLATGSYHCTVSAPACAVDGHQVRLYDTTGSATLVEGTTEFSDDSTYVTRSYVVGRFVLSTQSILEVQHYCNNPTFGDGWGRDAGITNEIYTVAEFWREV